MALKKEWQRETERGGKKENTAEDWFEWWILRLD